ncbi:hypothetical protein HL273_08770 [Yersinia enterocolitica]|nr:hypothetical protein [Yersinia enterocolitica]MBX9485829.1 hypothetical protein [Yersinia enterocolitica]NQS96710.1 hypothetical protein [Yersinia enterocolitica]NQT43387.1 hypothetical protein [Yersinia enterocolitica]NQT98813.1 hypothetical protein [Yersinia enterocolitica]HDL8115195.1 hypothetical protein [Yersinia enterocolitica]
MAFTAAVKVGENFTFFGGLQQVNLAVTGRWSVEIDLLSLNENDPDSP